MSEPNPFNDTPLEIRELSHFCTEFNKENDRGAVLIAAARLDEVLKAILSAYLRETSSAKELLGGFNAPLGTFSARASACHALGLIEDNEFDEITRIRKIRNEFGHKWKDISFETEKVLANINALPWLGPLEHEEGSTARTRFNFVVIILLTDLMWRKILVRRERVKVKIWSNKTR